ncbi:DUF3566 domain-containing protein [Rhodococcus sp. IEGM 1379]|uniref:DUF3566 domain-containing protein n=1 Tax=Rhodococcus sp. IEGM 1379 TaxID=3047086 RepID=UPI0024B69995|nr:DUF3566 domain-containing protein [Rhodococcus sp. IEGM 1379]MDI9917656.1 DUF3566 domain-containing protein [Rhodococcus sp. IEGM 1379]
MSTPNQPGSDQKSESTSGSTPPKPEQVTAPAGAGGSKPLADAKPDGPTAGAKAPVEKQAAPVADKPMAPVADKSAAPLAGKPAAAGAEKSSSSVPAAAASKAPEAPKAPEAQIAQARGNQAPPWQRGQQSPKQPDPQQQSGPAQQREPQTNITRPAAPRPDVRKGQPAPDVRKGQPAPAAQAGKPQTGPANQRPADRPSSGAPQGAAPAGRPSGPPPVRPAGQQTRPVITGIAAPKGQNLPAGNPVVGKPAAGNSAAGSSKAPGPKAKAAAIDGPTRHISRKDLPKDLPDLSEAKHPLPHAASSDKSHVAAGQASDGAPLRATVQIRRIDPWSTLKITSVISVSLFFVWMVAVGLLYVVLDGMGVWDRLNNAFTDIVSDSSSGGLVTAGQVFGYSAVIGVANMVLFTALVTIGSFIYNLCSDLVGGVEVTLADRD